MRIRYVAVLALVLGMVSLGCDKPKQVQMAEPPSPQPVTAPLVPIAAGDTGTSNAPKPPLVKPTNVVKSDVATEAPSGQPGKIYTIKKGDTFYSIARAVYNDPKRAKDIQAANPSVDPNKMPVGTVIKLPK